MNKIGWLIWIIKYGNPKTRNKSFKGYLALETYILCRRLIGHKIPGWTEQFNQKPLPAGKYILIKKPAPFAVELLNKVFTFGKEAQIEYLPYSPTVEAEMKAAGKMPEVREISYKLVARNQYE
ncbi:MAG: hypothetical protein H7Z37_01175 [Pyrinomonadaceae bacterium]|nr:hypothetical protein [Pyrinomonadaceae bacterium]